MSNDLELLTRSYVDQVQDLDTAATDLLVATSLDSAEGVQLDGLGQIIGVDRQGLDDEPYRSLLRAYVAINGSGGTIEQVITVARLATNTSLTDQAIVLTEGDIAELLVECTATLDADIAEVSAEAVQQAKAAAVYAVFQFHETTPIFAFDGDGGSQFDGGFYLSGAIGS